MKELDFINIKKITKKKREKIKKNQIFYNNYLFHDIFIYWIKV
jgi:hypothetical protein